MWFHSLKLFRCSIQLNIYAQAHWTDSTKASTTITSLMCQNVSVGTLSCLSSPIFDLPGFFLFFTYFIPITSINQFNLSRMISLDVTFRWNPWFPLIGWSALYNVPQVKVCTHPWASMGLCVPTKCGLLKRIASFSIFMSPSKKAQCLVRSRCLITVCWSSN